MEARLANMVHHMSGEADEDTMSAWSSLGGSGGGLASPGEIGPALSLRRRSSFGMQMASFSENPLQEQPIDHLTLDAELAEVGRGSTESDTIGGGTFGAVVERAKEGRGGGVGKDEAGTVSARASIGIGGAAETAAAGISAQIDGGGAVPSGDNSGVEPSSPEREKGQGEGPSAAAVETAAITTHHGSTEGRRRSNQDDQSNHNDSARSDSSITAGSVRGDEEASRGGGHEHPPPVNVQGSAESGGSDSRCAITDIAPLKPMSCPSGVSCPIISRRNLDRQVRAWFLVHCSIVGIVDT